MGLLPLVIGSDWGIFRSRGVVIRLMFQKFVTGWFNGAYLTFPFNRNFHTSASVGWRDNTWAGCCQEQKPDLLLGLSASRWWSSVLASAVRLTVPGSNVIILMVWHNWIFPTLNWLVWIRLCWRSTSNPTAFTSISVKEASGDGE